MVKRKVHDDLIARVCDGLEKELLQVKEGAVKMEDAVQQHKTELLKTLMLYGKEELPPTTDERQLADRHAITEGIDILLKREKKRKDREQKKKQQPEDEKKEEDEYVCVGYILFSFGYALTDSSDILTNPTCYLGNVAVHPMLRQCGIASALLAQGEAFLFHRFPLRAAMFLHYEESQMLEMCLRKKWITPISASRGQADDAQLRRHKKTDEAPKRQTTVTREETGGWWYTFLRLFVPRFAEYLDDKEEVAQLLSLGYTEGEIRTLKEARQRAATHMTLQEFLPDFLDDPLAFHSPLYTPEYSHIPEETFNERINPIIQIGASEIFANCLAERRELIEFYKKRGYVVLRVEKNFYELRDGETKDGILLCKSIEKKDAAHHAVQAAAEGKPPSSDAAGNMWLTPSNYEFVRAIVTSYTVCQQYYRKKHNKEEKAIPVWKEMLYSLNAIGALLAVLWYVYYKVL
ncbi:hypothetical protein AGDE_15703 [Angomonas deanei]|uniref:Acetyltransferase (GNAT) family, putative n=1 Tax=Angomonas deanei TaxID=59799 RepID=A0A7G2CTE5_9TRYP|nr:hypothetical protein AGDE_15703 [Angomonas deanei]CAD2222331.1 Acetyltransferase (GNAT) family, putative [Angomonas deanei]|eukprot:EPY18633.1 hypothetical protein AGDE_15703 [Angomonas deanei]